MAGQLIELAKVYRVHQRLRDARGQRDTSGGLIQSVHNAGSGDDISVYGHLDKYATEVRCIVSKNIVFFITIGPNLDQATKYREAVIDKF